MACEAKTGDALAKLVLISLANRADNNGECYPSLARIARDCETTERSVIRKLEVLESLELIKRIRRSEDGLKTSNLYRLPEAAEGYSVVTECHNDVTESYKGSDTVSPRVVTECHIKHPVETPIETPKKKGAKRKRFTPPTLEQVNQRISEMGYALDGERFFYYYESNGWRVGKNPMKDWHQALAGWNTRNKGEVANGKTGSSTGKNPKQSPGDRIRERLARKIADGQAV